MANFARRTRWWNTIIYILFRVHHTRDTHTHETIMWTHFYFYVFSLSMSSRGAIGQHFHSLCTILPYATVVFCSVSDTHLHRVYYYVVSRLQFILLVFIAFRSNIPRVPRVLCRLRIDVCVCTHSVRVVIFRPWRAFTLVGCVCVCVCSLFPIKFIHTARYLPRHRNIIIIIIYGGIYILKHQRIPYWNSLVLSMYLRLLYFMHWNK